ncbi:MAG: alpha/beta hydrolase [Cyanobacteria bacterium]|nr:alpha/beta hydrolase [Cyanobacteriota bacterium]
MASSGWQHEFIYTNQVRLHYVTQGEGELVVLLHGFFEFWYSWRHQIPALARRYKVVVPDLRGYNDSDKPLGGHDLNTLAQDIVGLVQGLGYQKAHIVGHGWGGTLAWHLAQTCPQIFRRLVVLSGVHPQQWRRAILDNVGILRRTWPLLAAQIPVAPEWMLQLVLPELIANWFRSQAVRKTAFTHQDTQLYTAALQKPGVITAAIEQYRHVFSWQSWLQDSPKNHSISIPTLILWGQEDTVVSQHLNQGIEEQMAMPIQIQTVPQCGHWIQQEVPDTVNRAILNFL